MVRIVEILPLRLNTTADDDVVAQDFEDGALVGTGAMRAWKI